MVLRVGGAGYGKLLGYKYRYCTGFPIQEACDPVFGAAAVLLGYNNSIMNFE